MIYVGLDDTDVLDSLGTNQIAKALVRVLSDAWRCRLIVRHQLLVDPRVPYTSHNSSASLWLTRRDAATACRNAPVEYPREEQRVLFDRICEFIRQQAAPGSDPGVCLATQVGPPVRDFGRFCQRRLATQQAARHLASEHPLWLTGLGGTEDGVIGALAAVGLATTRNDGRVVMIDDRDDLAGRVSIAELARRGVAVQCARSGAQIRAGQVDVGKHLRPNLRQGQVILYVEPQTAAAAPNAAALNTDLHRVTHWVAVRR